MASGDAQRTWFPEMIVRLRSEWHEGVSMPTLISLRDELDGMLQRIRTGRKIQTPIITCRRCGTTGRAAEPHVSVRALILALGRFGIASKDQTRALEKAWAEYRKQHRVDTEGKVPSRVPGICHALTIAAEVGPSPEFGGCAKVAGGLPRHDGTAKQHRILARVQRTRRL